MLHDRGIFKSCFMIANVIEQSDTPTLEYDEKKSIHQRLKLCDSYNNRSIDCKNRNGDRQQQRTAKIGNNKKEKLGPQIRLTIWYGFLKPREVSWGCSRCVFLCISTISNIQQMRSQGYTGIHGVDREKSFSGPRKYYPVFQRAENS